MVSVTGAAVDVAVLVSVVVGPVTVLVGPLTVVVGPLTVVVGPVIVVVFVVVVVVVVVVVDPEDGPVDVVDVVVVTALGM